MKNNSKDRAWHKMEELLDRQLPQERKRTFYSSYWIAASILLFTTLSVFIANKYESQHQNTIAQQVIQEAIKPLPNSPLEKTINTANNTLDVQDNIGHLEQRAAKSTSDKKWPKPSTSLAQSIEKVQIAKLSDNDGIPSLALQVKPTNWHKNQKVMASSNTATIPVKQNTTQSIEESAQSVIKKTSDQEGMMTNQKQKNVQFITPEIASSFMEDVDMGLRSSGSIGLVSKNLDDFGIRFGFELEKPISSKMSINLGIRYSAYKDNYKGTYEVDTPEFLKDDYIVESMANRDVARNFVEIPLYANYKVVENLNIKGGASLTYNKNNSEDPILSTNQIINSNSLSTFEKKEVGRLISDSQGYLGEVLVGATYEMGKISVDLEATRGFINNQNIENRNVLGMRLNYRFGN